MRAAAAVVLAMLLGCSRELPEGAVSTVVERSAKGGRVLFVGLDGADWRLVDPFVADGTMPELKQILDRAERRVLLTEHPPLSPLVWTTMMTGVSPLEHRILDFTRFHPKTGEQEPITSDERAAPAVWNMVLAGGKRAGVFGMWATFPPEPGVIVTSRDVPRDYVKATEETHRRATEWIRDAKPDLAIVYFQGTDEIGHFTSGEVAKSRDYFRRIDSILGDYRRLASQLDAELIIASDHGFDWGGRHEESSTATATAAKWHREEGIWIRWPRAKSSGEPAKIAQVCATLVDALGLPRGEGLASAIGGAANQQSVNYRRFFSRVSAAAPAAGEEVAKLRALGYIGSDEPSRGDGSSTRTPASFNNEGLILKAANRVDEAERAFRSALVAAPAYGSARHNLDDLLSARGVQRLRSNDCRGAVADLREVTRETALLWSAIAAAEGCLGNERESREAVGRSLALDPNQPELRKLSGIH